MDNQVLSDKILDFIKARQEPVTLTQIVSGIDSEVSRLEVAGIVRNLERQGDLYTSLKDGKAYFSADIENQRISNPAKENVIHIQKALENDFEKQTSNTSEPDDIEIELDPNDDTDDGVYPLASLADLTTTDNTILSGSISSTLAESNTRVALDNAFSLVVPKGMKFSTDTEEIGDMPVETMFAMYVPAPQSVRDKLGGSIDESFKGEYLASLMSLLIQPEFLPLGNTLDLTDSDTRNHYAKWLAYSLKYIQQNFGIECTPFVVKNDSKAVAVATYQGEVGHAWFFIGLPDGFYHGLYRVGKDPAILEEDVGVDEMIETPEVYRKTIKRLLSTVEVFDGAHEHNTAADKKDAEVPKKHTDHTKPTKPTKPTKQTEQKQSSKPEKPKPPKKPEINKEQLFESIEAKVQKEAACVKRLISNAWENIIQKEKESLNALLKQEKKLTEQLQALSFFSFSQKRELKEKIAALEQKINDANQKIDCYTRRKDYEIVQINRHLEDFQTFLRATKGDACLDKFPSDWLVHRLEWLQRFYTLPNVKNQKYVLPALDALLKKAWEEKKPITADVNLALNAGGEQQEELINIYDEIKAFKEDLKGDYNWVLKSGNLSDEEKEVLEILMRHDKCTVSEIFRMSNCTEINSTHQVTEILLRLCNQNLVVRTEEKSRPFYSIAR